VTARCSFRVHASATSNTYFSRLTTDAAVFGSNTPHPTAIAQTKSAKLSTARYIVPQIFELYGMLRKLRKIKLFLYFYKIFKGYQPRFKFFGKVANFSFRELHAVWRLRQRNLGSYFFLTRSSLVFGKYVDRRISQQFASL